jgi:8-oxo-dGTP pyrophosphatase MutT (NUDIX family)
MVSDPSIPSTTVLAGNQRVTAASVSFARCGAGVLPFDNVAHAARCPAFHGTFPRAPLAADGAGVPAEAPLLAASVIVVDCRGRVLLTRRSAFMRTFPLHYVVPGGGCDPCETLWGTARRECWEETGIELPPCPVTTAAAAATRGNDADGPSTEPPPMLASSYDFGKPIAAAEADAEAVGGTSSAWHVSWFGAWESCFPVEPAAEAPKRHHIVAFFLARQLAGAGQELPPTPGVKMSEECDAFVWADPAEIAQGGLLLAEGTRYMAAQVAHMPSL